LVKTSNPAAKTILGFISPAGMSADDMFRGAVISRQSAADADILSTSNPSGDELSDEPVCVADEVAAALRPGSHRRRIEAEYETPAGERRFLAVTVSPVPAEDGTLLGVACVIDDRSELELMRQGLPPRQERAAAGAAVGSTIS
jgi:PAS domain-containing protein